MKKAIEVLRRYLHSIDEIVAEEFEKDEINIAKIQHMTRKQVEIHECMMVLEREVLK